MFLLVVTAALKLEPDTTFLVNANVPKNLSSADLSNKNNDFLLTSLDILALFFFFSVVRFSNQCKEGKAGFYCHPALRGGGTVPGHRPHIPPVSCVK